jgi:hypothetical protein
LTPVPVSRPICAALLALALLLAACGGGSDPTTDDAPQVGVKGEEEEATTDLGFPAFATKNTTRVGGADPIADAAAVARAVYPSVEQDQRPRAVALVDVDDWQAGVAAAALFADPIGAPVLLSDSGELPGATSGAIEALAPTGSKEVGNAQVIRVGDVPEVEGRETTDITGKDGAELAARIDATISSARGRTSDRVLVVASERPELAVPAAGWAAKSGDPVLFTGKDALPAATKQALRRHEQPRIYVLGDEQVVSEKVFRELRKLGTARRIEGTTDPVQNAIDFAKYADGTWGWNVRDPGHGLVFVNASRPMDAVAAAPLSATGTYGPLLLHTGKPELDRRLESYLLDIQPGYDRDPVRGVYNHGWIIGDEKAMPIAVQSRIDALLEITKVQNDAEPSS